MDFQNYQETKPTPQNQQIAYEPINTTPNNQADPSEVYPSNSQQNQFNQNSQYQNQNCNIIYQEQMTQNDQYILIPQETFNTPFEDNILEIPIKKKKIYCLFIFMFISIIMNSLPTIVLIDNIIIPILFMVGNIVLLYIF